MITCSNCWGNIRKY